MAKFSHGIDGLTLFQLGLLMGIITTGGGSLVTSSNETNATGDTNEIHLPWQFPCPEAEDIFPCVCSYHVESKTVDMNCSNVTSEVQLRAIFNKEFHYTNFRKLTIKYNRNITTLKAGDLGNVSFTEIEFTDGVLTDIDFLIFKASWDTITSLLLWNNKLTYVPDIWNFTRLSVLDLYGNELTQFPFLRSKTLKSLTLGNNNFSHIPVQAILALPLLETFACRYTALTEIQSGTFSLNNEHLRYLDLTRNQLTIIPKDAIMLHGEHTELWLYQNQLTSLPYEVVSGVTSELDMGRNKLEELPEMLYRPLLEKDVEVRLDENPFGCGCDIAWLIENRTLLMKLAFVNYTNMDAPRCSDGVRFIDLDPQVYKDMCDDSI